MQARNTQSQRFPTSVEHLETWDNQEDSIELASSSLLDNSENGAVRIIFATYNEFDQLLVPSQRPNATLRFVNSKVISASLGKGRHVKLREPVKITLKHLKTVNVSRPVCVYWDYASHSWSNTGCTLITSNMTHSQCQCDHLTNFALIMEDGPGEVTSTLTSLSSQVTTVIACVATLVCVSLMMVCLVMTWRRFRVTHQCRSMLQKSGIPCFHKTKELSEKDKKQGNFYTVTPKLNGSVNNNSGGAEPANIEMDNQQYFEHMISLQKNQENLVINKTMSRRNTLNNSSNNDTQETVLSDDLSKVATVSSVNINTLKDKKSFKGKTQCQHVMPNNFQLGMTSDPGAAVLGKKTNISRAMSPFNHIYQEIDTKPEEGSTVYEAVNQASEASRSETYMLSSVSDMSDDDFRRNCSDVSRQSSSRYAEHKPLIRAATRGNNNSISGSQHFPAQNNVERNLLTTISGVMQSQSVRVAPTHQRTSILSTISGLRYTVDPDHTTIAPAGHDHVQQEAPVHVNTNIDGDQFVCLNLADQNGNPGTQPIYTSSVPPPQYAYDPTTSLNNTPQQQQFYLANPQQQQQQLINFGTIQAPVHSQLVIQRVGTLPRQYAHPLAQI